MNTEQVPDLAHVPNTALLLRTETEQILGCAFEVLNELGHGFHEKIYENGLAIAFRLKDILFDQQRKFPVLFRGCQVGEFTPDLLDFDAVVVDLKVIEKITDHEHGRMINYLRITQKRVGLILNFKCPRLQWDRLVL